VNFDFLTGEVLLRSALPSVAVVIAIVGLLAVRRPARPLPIGGALIVGLAYVAYLGTIDYGLRLWMGVAMCAVASFVGARLPVPLHVAAIVPGAALTVSGLGDDPEQWMIALAVVVVSVAGAGADRFDRSHSLSSVPFVMLVGMIGGVFLTIPETDVYSFLLVVATPMLWLGWPRQLVRIGAGGGAAAMALVAAMTLDGGSARSGSIIGGLFAAGLLLFGLSGTHFPLVNTPKWSGAAYRLIASQAVLIFLVVRVAGLRQGAIAAGVLVVVFYVVAFVVAPRWINNMFDRA